jgi:hypothetical protein
MKTRRLVILLIVTFGPACASPVAPGPQPAVPAPAMPGPPAQLDLQVGPQWLYLRGIGLVVNSNVAPCQPTGVPASGTSVTTAVDVTSEHGEWVARSRAPEAGSVELRFHETGATGGNVSIEGTVAGAAADMAYVDLYAPSDSRVAFISQAVVDGHGDLYSSYVGGRIRGAIQFMDSQGRVGTCSSIEWALLP